MKVLLVNGSPHPKGCTYTALREVAGQLEKEGVGSVMLQLGTRPVQDCIACGKCAETGLCVFKDDPVNEAIGLLKECDGLVVGSPVYYGGPTGSLCSFLDRLCFRKAAPYAGKPAACAVSCRCWRAVCGMAGIPAPCGCWATRRSPWPGRWTAPALCSSPERGLSASAKTSMAKASAWAGMAI